MTKEEFILRHYTLHLSFLHNSSVAVDVLFNDKCRQAALEIATEDANFIERNHPELFEHVQYTTQAIAGNPIEAPSCPPDTDDDYEAFKSSIEQILHEPIDFFRETTERLVIEDVSAELAITFDAIRISKRPSLYLSPHGKMLAQGVIRTAARLYACYFYNDNSDGTARFEGMEEYLKYLCEHICDLYPLISKEEEDEYEFIERIEKQVKKLENMIAVLENHKEAKIYMRDILNAIIIDCAIYFHRCPIPVDYKDYGHAAKCFRSMFSNK